jgi:putative FmdB family regulatory protein
MPIYEYQCKKCGEFEVVQKITDNPLKRCPTCRGKVTKLISNTSFQLKGTGWYVTDYGRKEGKSKESGTGSASSTADKSSPASDTTASKTETKASSSKGSSSKEVAAA